MVKCFEHEIRRNKTEAVRAYMKMNIEGIKKKEEMIEYDQE